MSFLNDFKSGTLHDIFKSLSLPFQNDEKERVIDYNWHVDSILKNSQSYNKDGVKKGGKDGGPAANAKIEEEGSHQPEASKAKTVQPLPFIPPRPPGVYFGGGGFVGGNPFPYNTLTGRIQSDLNNKLSKATSGLSQIFDGKAAPALSRTASRNDPGNGV